MKIYQSVFFICVTLFTADLAFAITPLQYCERLHARRPANVASSFELLNTEVPTSSTITVPIMSAQGCGANGCWPGTQTGTRVYTLTKNLKKCCINGEYKFSIMTKLEYVNECTGTAQNGAAGTCPDSGNIACEGSACIVSNGIRTSQCD